MQVGNFVTSAFLDGVSFVERPDMGSESLNVVLVVRCVLGFTGYAVMYNGMWLLVDVYVFENTLLRNLLFYGVGLVVLFFTNALKGNVLVDPYCDDEDDDEEAHDSSEEVRPLLRAGSVPDVTTIPSINGSPPMTPSMLDIQAAHDTHA